MPSRLPWSRRPAPAQALAGLDLAEGERALAAATTAEGAYIVATDRALWLPGPGGARPLPWTSVERAGWDRDRGLLVVVETARPARHEVALEAPGRLVDVVREQVTASVVISRTVPVAGTRGVRVVGRRRPGHDRLVWSATAGPGVDLADPRVRALVEAAVGALRAEVGEAPLSRPG